MLHDYETPSDEGIDLRLRGEKFGIECHGWSVKLDALLNRLRYRFRWLIHLPPLGGPIAGFWSLEGECLSPTILFEKGTLIRHGPDEPA